MDICHQEPKRVSLQQIADAAKVSKATACRALLGRKRVSGETADRIQALAEEMGYRPDPTLSALSRHRWSSTARAKGSYSIAVVRVKGPDWKLRPGTASSSDGRPDPVYVDRARELGVMTEEFTLEDYPSPDHLARILHARGVDGILFLTGGPTAPWNFLWDRFSCVSVGYDSPEHQAHAVVNDWFEAVLLAASKVSELGYRRIGFANFHRANERIDARTEGAIAFCRTRFETQFGPQPKVFTYPADRVLAKDVFKAERENFLRWLDAEKPDVVIDSNSFCWSWLSDAGFKMPKDIGYASLLSDIQRSIPADLSGVSIERNGQARWGMDLLFNLMQLNVRGFTDSPVRIVVGCRWNQGKTVRANPPSRKSPPKSRG